MRFLIEPGTLTDMRCGVNGEPFEQVFRPRYVTAEWCGGVLVEVRIWGPRVLKDGSLGKRELDHRWKGSRATGGVDYTELPPSVAGRLRSSTTENRRSTGAGPKLPTSVGDNRKPVSAAADIAPSMQPAFREARHGQPPRAVGRVETEADDRRDYPHVAGAAPPAGWYPDPQGQPRHRYWDGQRWTDHFTPTQLDEHGLRARADQQHRWVSEGDLRGIYGEEGADLMRAFIEPTRRPIGDSAKVAQVVYTDPDLTAMLEEQPPLWPATAFVSVMIHVEMP